MRKLDEARVRSPAVAKVIRYDSIPLKATYTAEGYLRDTPIVTSVGIFDYHNEDGSIRKELRLPEHVFAPESLKSYKGKPVIVTHDAGTVNKNNVEQEAIGTILSDGIRDGNDVRAEIIIHDTDELKRCGLKELSLGYSLDLIEEPGEWQGQHYDAIQTNIMINHLALVSNARAGEQARLNIDGKDTSKKGGKNMANTTKKKAKRRDEDDTAVELAKTVLEQAGEEGTVAGDDDNTPMTTDPAAAQQGAQEGGAQPSEELLKSIRDRKDRRDSDQDEAPTNLDEANEVIRQQNEDIDALLEMLDKKQEGENKEETPVPNADEDDDEKQNADDDDENNDDDDENAEGGSEEEKPTVMNADSIDALVRARAAMSRLGEQYNIDGLDDLSMINAMRKVISVATPGIRLDSEAEIKGAFRVAVATLKSQKTIADQRKQMHSGMRADGYKGSEADAARQRMINKRK